MSDELYDVWVEDRRGCWRLVGEGLDYEAALLAANQISGNAVVKPAFQRICRFPIPDPDPEWKKFWRK